MNQKITSQCFWWFLPVCPPKLNFTSVLQSAVLISDIEKSPGVLQSYPLFSRCRISVVICTVSLSHLSSPAPMTSFLTLSSQDIFFFFHEPTVKRARAHTDAVLYVSRVFKLFIFWSIAFTELCSNSSRVIYYDKNFIVNRVVFRLYLFPCFNLGRLSRPPQQHCMWLTNGYSENSLSSSVNWRECEEEGLIKSAGL